MFNLFYPWPSFSATIFAFSSKLVLGSFRQSIFLYHSLLSSVFFFFIIATFQEVFHRHFLVPVSYFFSSLYFPCPPSSQLLSLENANPCAWHPSSSAPMLSLAFFFFTSLSLSSSLHDSSSFYSGSLPFSANPVVSSPWSFTSYSNSSALLLIPPIPHGDSFSAPGPL